MNVTKAASQFQTNNGSTSCAVQTAMWHVTVPAAQLSAKELGQLVADSAKAYCDAREKGLWTDSAGYTNASAISASMRPEGAFVRVSYHEVAVEQGAAGMVGLLEEMQEETSRGICLTTGAYVTGIRRVGSTFFWFDSHIASVSSMDTLDVLIAALQLMIESRCGKCTCGGRRGFTCGGCHYAVDVVDLSHCNMDKISWQPAVTDIDPEVVEFIKTITALDSGSVEAETETEDKGVEETESETDRSPCSSRSYHYDHIGDTCGHQDESSRKTEEEIRSRSEHHRKAGNLSSCCQLGAKERRYPALVSEGRERATVAPVVAPQRLRNDAFRPKHQQTQEEESCRRWEEAEVRES